MVSWKVAVSCPTLEAYSIEGYRPISNLGMQTRSRCRQLGSVEASLRYRSSKTANDVLDLHPYLALGKAALDSDGV